jgi:hypothetical protein
MNRGFKRQTIKKILRNKVKQWLNSLPESLIPVGEKNVIVCGGAISSLLMGETPNDYDLYLKRRSAVKVFADYYVEVFNSSNTLRAINNYQPVVQERDVVNIQNVTEERIKIVNKSAGVAAENQGVYQYFESQSESRTEDFFDSIAQHPVEMVEEIVEELQDKKKSKYRPVFLTDNAITLSDKVQLIIRFYGEAEEIHKNFDFIHCMSAYDYETDELFIPQEALEAILSRTLVYKGSLYPIASIFRTRKFIDRGWRITAGQMLKMIWQVNELDLKNLEILQEQLIGVDQAYMHELIYTIQQEKGKNIDSIYIAKLIDEIFE